MNSCRFKYSIGVALKNKELKKGLKILKLFVKINTDKSYTIHDDRSTQLTKDEHFKYDEMTAKTTTQKRKYKNNNTKSGRP